MRRRRKGYEYGEFGNARGDFSNDHSTLGHMEGEQVSRYEWIILVRDCILSYGLIWALALLFYGA